MNQTTTGPIEPHSKGKRARVLLTSVFGPYARDDEFGSRTINPMEHYQNQVTREQGAFSLRMFHRSWGIMMIQRNIAAACTVLDFPAHDLFEHELATGHYDIVGISSIIINVAKVREMCRMVRRLSPGSVIIVGGHVTATPGIEHTVDADHFVRTRHGHCTCSPRPTLFASTRCRKRLLARGVTYEPKPIIERHNWPLPEASSTVDGRLQGGRIPAPMPEPQ